MKHLLILLTTTIALSLNSCGQEGGGGENLNEDPTGNERGTPGTGTHETGTGQEPHHLYDTARTSPPGTPHDTARP